LYLCENRSTLPQGIAITILQIARYNNTSLLQPSEDDFCKEVQRQLPRITYLLLDLGGDLSVLKYVPNLNSIYIDGSLEREFTNLSILGEIPNLRTLIVEDIHNFHVRDLSTATKLEKLMLQGVDISQPMVLSKLTNLVELHIPYVGDTIPYSTIYTDRNLRQNYRNNISFLSSLTSLRKLKARIVSSGKNAIDRENILNPLKKLKQLRELELEVFSPQTIPRSPNVDKSFSLHKRSETRWPATPHVSPNSVEDGKILKPLSHLNSLAKLSLEIEQITDVKPLATLVNLQTLHLKSLMLKDLRPLAKLTRLQELFIQGKTIEDVSPLDKLNNLTQLRISSYIDTKSKIGDIRPLSKLNGLTYLMVENSHIRKIPPLQKMQNSRELYLSDNDLVDLSGLKNLNNLTEVVLENNQLTTLNSLPILPKLQKINLRNNRLRDISKLRQLTSLESVNLTGNPQLAKVCPLQRGSCGFD
jgi:internalin A